MAPHRLIDTPAVTDEEPDLHHPVGLSPPAVTVAVSG
jgi:hypothetical protein